MKNPERVVYFLSFQLSFDMRVISVTSKLAEFYSIQKNLLKKTES